MARTPPVSIATWAAALAAAPGRRLAQEWTATPFHDLALSAGKPRGMAARVRAIRPGDVETGRALLAGEYAFGGQTMRLGAGADPFDGLTPSRAFAEGLQRFGWIGHLLALGDAGAAEALRLTLAWRRLFRRCRPFAWDEAVLRARVVALACATPAMLAVASDAEGAAILGDLSRQARRLMAVGGDPAHAAERAAAAAIAASALGGPGPARLRERALKRLERLLPDAVLPDGVHATRSPEATLELLTDLLTLDDALTQLGRPPGPELSRAIDRLTGAVRLFTLSDGRLAAMQGGGEASAARIAAALAHDDGERAVVEVARDGGYQRMGGAALQVFVDAGAPAQGPWSVAAVAAPCAVEILAKGRRLVTGPSLRLDDFTPGRRLTGFAAWALGPRLVGARWRVTPRRSEGEGVTLVEISHDAWLRRLGVRTERRLYLDAGAPELRGEERFIPTKGLRGDARRFVPYEVAFPLHPDVRAQVSLDGKSVVIRFAADPPWVLRADAAEIRLEPIDHLEGGQPRRTTRIVLAGLFRLQAGGRVRWKLAKG